jgi:predicted glycosyltransferase involved in capsule biosynthesis
MDRLTIVVPNRDRLDFTQLSSQYFLKSLQWQKCLDFEMVVIDGGSKNYEEIKKQLESNDKFKTIVIQHKIGEVFHKTLLNNIAIRSIKDGYVMTTDADILFHPDFICELRKRLSPNVFVESRVMYLKPPTIEKLYKGEINQYNIDAIKEGRIKKRTTPGAAQCMHRSNWDKLHGYDEEYVGWGSEDYDLVLRAGMILKTVWMGESTKEIMAFHQPHSKTVEQIKKDLAYQEENKKILSRIVNPIVNPKSWGGISET